MSQTTPPDLVRQRAEFLVDNLRRYLAFFESRINQALAEEHEEVRDWQQAVIDVYGDDVWTDADVEILQEQWGCDDPDSPFRPYSPLHYVFPRYLRYSFVMLAAIVFESELLVLCLSIATTQGVAPPASGGKGPTASKARMFLSANLGEASIDAKNWDRLQDMLKVRNCIAHAGGRVDLSSDRDHLQSLVRRNIGLSIDEEERPGVRLLNVDTQYCESIVAEVASLFKSVCDAAGYGGDED